MRALAIALFAASCASPVTVSEPIAFDTDLRVFAVFDESATATALTRDQPFVSDRVFDHDSTVLLLGYKASELPYPGLRGRSPAEIAALLRPNFLGHGVEAPPAPETFEIDAAGARGGERWLPADGGAIADQVAALHARPLAFDLPDEVTCPNADRRFDLYWYDEPRLAADGTFGAGCKLAFGVSMGDKVRRNCRDFPSLVSPEGDLVLESGARCPPVAPGRGADLAFACPSETCAPEPRTLALQLRREWGFEPVVPEFFASDDFAIRGGGVPLGGGALFTYGQLVDGVPKTVFQHFTGADGTAVRRRLALQLDGGVPGFLVVSADRASTRVLVFAYADQPAFEIRTLLDYRDGELTNPRPVSVDFDHSGLVLSRDGTRIYAYGPAGLVVIDADTLAVIAQSGIAITGAPIAHALYLVDSPEGERVVTCFDPGETRGCRDDTVEVFDRDAHLLYRVGFDRTGAQKIDVLNAIDGPRIIARVTPNAAVPWTYDPMPAESNPPPSTLAVVDAETGRRTDYPLPSWVRDTAGWYLPRDTFVKFDDKEWLVVVSDNSPAVLDLGTGLRSVNEPPPGPWAVPFLNAVWPGPDGFLYALFAIGAPTQDPLRAERVEVARIKAL